MFLVLVEPAAQLDVVGMTSLISSTVKPACWNCLTRRGFQTDCCNGFKAVRTYPRLRADVVLEMLLILFLCLQSQDVCELPL